MKNIAPKFEIAYQFPDPLEYQQVRIDLKFVNASHDQILSPHIPWCTAGIHH